MFPRLFFFLKNGVFSHATYAKKKVYATYTKKKISVERKCNLRPKTKKVTYAYFHNRATLSSLKMIYTI